MDAQTQYWSDCISEAADEAGGSLTPEQLLLIAQHVEGAHENYGMAFYSPPSSDRYNEIEREWKAKFKALEAKFDRYQNDAETAVKVALNQHHDARISIGQHGEVRKHDGRSDRIQ